MKTLFSTREDQPVQVGAAWRFNPSVWLVTCKLSREAAFGVIRLEAEFVVEGGSAEEAEADARARALESHPEFRVTSVHVAEASPSEVA
jgi:hypothetical protein